MENFVLFIISIGLLAYIGGYLLHKLKLFSNFVGLAIEQYTDSIKSNGLLYIGFVAALALIYLTDVGPLQSIGFKYDKHLYVSRPDLFYLKSNLKEHWLKDSILTTVDSYQNAEMELDNFYAHIKKAQNDSLVFRNNKHTITAKKTGETSKDSFVVAHIIPLKTGKINVCYYYPFDKGDDTESSLIFSFLTVLIGLIIGIMIQIFYRSIIHWEAKAQREGIEIPVFLIYGVVLLVFSFSGAELFYTISTQGILGGFKISLNNMYARTPVFIPLLTALVFITVYLSKRMYKLVYTNKHTWNEIKAMDDLYFYAAAVLILLVGSLVALFSEITFPLLSIRQLPETLQIAIMIFFLDTVIAKTREIEYARTTESFTLYEIANPHLVQNAISTVSMIIHPTRNKPFISEEDRQEASEWLTELKIFMHFMLERYEKKTSYNNFVTLADEVEFIRRFIVFSIKGKGVQDSTRGLIRFNGIPIFGTLDDIPLESRQRDVLSTVKIPQLILVEGVVNSLKYFEETDGIDINLSYRNNTLDFEVKNHIDRNKLQTEKTSSKQGLNLTRDILSLAYQSNNYNFSVPDIDSNNSIVFRYFFEIYDVTKVKSNKP